MSLNITIKRGKVIRCPDCGKVVYTEVTGYVSSSGRWAKFLDIVGYDKSYRGTDMHLTEDQVLMLLKSVSDNTISANAIRILVSMALACDESVTINADW